MLTAAMLLASLGKWRYVITGTAFALLFGLFCRACGKLLAPFGIRRRFSAVCTAAEPQNGKTAVTVTFTDSRRITHTAAFLTEEPVAAGSELQIAVRAEVFASGVYPQSIAQAAEAGSDVITGNAYRKQLRNTLLRELAVQLLICGIALAVFVAAMRICFP